MQLIKSGDGLVRQPPMPNSPSVTVIAGGETGGPDVGLVRVEMPAGCRMAPHAHGGSDIIVTPIVGSVQIGNGTETIDVNVGDSALVTREETVSLTNSADETAHLIVAAGPATFITRIRAWPDPVAH